MLSPPDPWGAFWWEGQSLKLEIFTSCFFLSHFLSAVRSGKENMFRVQGYLPYQEKTDFSYKGPGSEQ